MIVFKIISWKNPTAVTVTLQNWFRIKFGRLENQKGSGFQTKFFPKIMLTKRFISWPDFISKSYRIKEIYLKMYSTSLSDIYHDIPAFTVNGMVRNVKN